MKTVIRNSYTPKTGDYCETIVVDKETENAYIFDCDGVFTEVPQPVDVEKILEEAAAYTDEQVAPLAEKLDTIEEGAQVNVIETVMKNGTPLTVTNKTVNVTVPTKTSDLTNDGSDGTDTYVESATLSDYYTKTETDTQIGYETNAREIADQGLQEQIDAIAASSDVVDIVGTYADLQAYDTSKLHNNDIIKVLADETKDGATTYYRWSTSTEAFSYIGEQGPFYTKGESDATFVPQTRTVNSKALSADITLTAADVGALPDSTVIPTVNDATLTIQKNGTDVATFTANSATNATANISVPTDTSDLTNGAGFITSAALPTKTSELTNDGSDGTDTYAEMGDLPTKTSDLQNDGADGTSTYVEADELATVATTGDYDDLLNKPTIPTVNNATLTIQKNGTAIDTFTANASVDKTINVTVPTDTSDLTNNAGFITNSVSNLTNYYTKTDTYTQQEVNSLINTITIPTKTSDLTNDGEDGTSTYVEASDLTGYQEKLVAGTNISIASDGKTISATDTTYSDFTGATAQDAGVHGLVPAPAAGDEDKVLKGDGTWGAVAAPYTAGTGIDITNNVISADTTVLATQTDLSSKQDTLTAGDAIDITSNVISVEADSALDVSSTKPVQNSVITAALGNKQDTLTAGSNIQINNNTISATDTTYSNFVGTDGQTAGTAGLVPAPATTDVGEYLKADGTWDTPPGVTYTAGSNIQINGTVISATDTTYSDFTGATSSVAGAHGLVPAPTTSDTDKYLKGDGTWGTVSAGLVEMSYGESNAWQKFIDAYNANKIVYCRASSNANPGTGAKTRKAFMAYVNNESAPTSVEFQYVRSVGSKTSSQPVDQVFVYTLTNASGGTWSVVTRDMAPKLAAGTNTTVSYSNGTYTVNATQPTVPTKTSDLTNDGSDGTSTYVEADDLNTTLAGYQQVLTAGAHIDITGSTISAEDYVHSENPVSVVDPGQTVSGTNITDGSIAFSKVDSTQFLKLQLTTTDPGEGSPLAANTLLGVYE